MSEPDRARAASLRPTQPATFEQLRNETTASYTLAEIDDAGVNRKQLRSARWRRSSHGRWAPAQPDRQPTAQRIVDALPLVPPDGALAGWAAAFVHGVHELDGLHPHTLRPLPVIVALARNVGRSQAAGVRYSRERLEPADVVELHGVRVTSVVRTAFDLARWADDLAEGVAQVDAVLNVAPIGDELTRWASDRRGWRGVPLARQVAAIARPGALSGWESRLRVRYEVDAGLPPPLLNPRLEDVDGRLLGYPDLFDPEAGLVTEFDGGDHLDRLRHSRDNVREEWFENANLTVVRIDSVAWRSDRHGVVDRLRSGYRRGQRRDRARDLWRLVDSDPPFCAQ